MKKSNYFLFISMYGNAKAAIRIFRYYYAMLNAQCLQWGTDKNTSAKHGHTYLGRDAFLSVKIFGTFLLTLALTGLVKAQSTSVFDASYFDKNNTTPPIKIGKGFHMNDIYKQTRSCFTAGTAASSKLTSQQTGGRKTSIKLFYTKTNEEFSVFKSRGASGKVSFLNLFSLGGQKLEEFANTAILDEERLIFTANVDFGVYTFDHEPTLIPEAKLLITQNKANDFVKMYGTHYISGIRKESNITVVLTKTSSKSATTGNNHTSLKADGIVPLKRSGSFELENRVWINKFIENNEFSVTVEINGPATDQSLIQSKVNTILGGSSANKSDAIAEIISAAIKGISDPKQSVITQYYYTPFSLYGLDGIFWDEKKQNQLTKINEAVVKIYSAKSNIAEFISSYGNPQMEIDLRSQSAPEEYIEQFKEKYREAESSLTLLSKQAEMYLTELETRYNNCADIFCPNNSDCCNNESFLSEINEFGLDGKVHQEFSSVVLLYEEIKAEINKPECEKKKQGIVIVKNISANPYHIYKNGEFIETLSGKSTATYYLNMGTYNFKAVQQSGYIIYATENIRLAVIGKVCQEIPLRVGVGD